MTPPRVKICCIASAAEARLAIAEGATALGLVGPMPSGPGVIDIELAGDIARAQPPGVSTFWLTSDTEPDAIVTQMIRVGASTAQLVRQLEPDAHLALRARLPTAVRLIQVVHIEDESAIRYARHVSATVDALLLDSGRPSAGVLGGTGRSHDWEISRQIVEAVDVPIWLAGGLRAENVVEAIAGVRPFGLDVCSGVRTDDQLDPDKLRALMRASRLA